MKKNRYIIWLWLSFILIVILGIIIYIIYANIYHPYVGGAKLLGNLLKYLGGRICI